MIELDKYYDNHCITKTQEIARNIATEQRGSPGPCFSKVPVTYRARKVSLVIIVS